MTLEARRMVEARVGRFGMITIGAIVTILAVSGGAFVIAGANIGLLSGKGSWLRGRLPAVVLGATAGWMAGQASVMRNRRYIEELVIHSQQLELLLEQTAP